jgi:hypothetical protein
MMCRRDWCSLRIGCTVSTDDERACHIRRRSLGGQIARVFVDDNNPVRKGNVLAQMLSKGQEWDLLGDPF